MNRQEIIEQIKLIQAGLTQDDNNKSKRRLDLVIEELEKPMSLADFLGWEEDVEYEWNDYTYKISKGSILYRSLFSGKYEMFCSKYLSQLSEAKKARKKRYNLILQKGYIKLFDLQDNEKYLTMAIDDGTIFHSKYSNNNSKYQAQFTLEEIEKIKKDYNIDLSIYEVMEVQE